MNSGVVANCRIQRTLASCSLVVALVPEGEGGVSSVSLCVGGGVWDPPGWGGGCGGAAKCGSGGKGFPRFLG